jgi:predicted transcriptional regulator
MIVHDFALYYYLTSSHYSLYCLKDMKYYRTRTDIISQILEAANGGNVTKTKIMYKAYLSFTQMKEYLMLLTENDLLRYEKDTQTFKTTEKGMRLLQMYNHIEDLIKYQHKTNDNN